MTIMFCLFQLKAVLFNCKIGFNRFSEKYQKGTKK